jgi:F-box interacting protein
MQIRQPMADIPFVILMEEIIARVPARTIGRCKCVCTRWRDFLSTTEFAHHHHRTMTKSTPYRFLSVADRDGSLHTFIYDPPTCRMQDIVNIPFCSQPRHILILAELHGMLCVSIRNTNAMVIWNPLTRAYKNITTTEYRGSYEPESDSVGFYTAQATDCRILHITQRQDKMTAYVYSTRSGSWRQTLPPTLNGQHTSGYNWATTTNCGETLYLTSTSRGTPQTQALHRFNGTTETFTNMTFPQTYDNQHSRNQITRVHNNLQMLVTHRPLHTNTELWKLEDGEWTQLMRFNNINHVNISTISFLKYMTPHDIWLIMTVDGDICELNQNLQELGPSYPSKYFSPLARGIYTESIISPNTRA